MQAGTTRLELPGQNVGYEKVSKYAKSKLSYKSALSTVKQDSCCTSESIHSFRAVDKYSLVSYYCFSFSAELSNHPVSRVFHTSVAVPSELNRRILESLQFQGEQ